MMDFYLFPTVHAFYSDLQQRLPTAQRTIQMAYYAFDDGRWAQAISQTLAQKAAEGVAVKLMVDEAGLYLDNVRHGWRNRQLLLWLRQAGVQVDLFRPNGRCLSQFNRLHCKFCVIDEQTAFIGGSNIGDHYVGWRDSNLRLDGALGSDFGRLYEGLRCFGGSQNEANYVFCGDDLRVGDMPLVLTVPGRRQDIRQALLALIWGAETAVTLRTWYFLPDREIMNALQTQAKRGVRVTILLSHHTRIPIVDLANRPLCRQLAAAGVQIYRYAAGYMHAKAAWTEAGDILFGSANFDHWALRTNFECCLHIKNEALAHELRLELLADIHHCQLSTSQRGQPQPLLHF
ncbi:MAG: hypothetical protein H6658_19255 [Ardenticatenaceae bacterium]|nr:hypothetical protein [Ardenticatenaceae bacterium]